MLYCRKIIKEIFVLIEFILKASGGIFRECKVSAHIVRANTLIVIQFKQRHLYIPNQSGVNSQPGSPELIASWPLEKSHLEENTFRKCCLRVLWSSCFSLLDILKVTLGLKTNPFSPGPVLSPSPFKAQEAIRPHWSIQAGLEHPGEKS